MGSYGIIIKTEEIRRRVQNGDYDSAQKILDTIPLKEVKNIADLSLFAEVYIHIAFLQKYIYIMKSTMKPWNCFIVFIKNQGPEESWIRWLWLQ